MEFVKTCTQRSVRRAAVWAVLCVLAGLLVMGLTGAEQFLRRPRGLYSVPEGELEGAWVQVELPILYGSYASTEAWENGQSTGRVLSVEYVIDANEYSFCGLLLPEDQVARGEELMAQSDRYWTGETGELPQGFPVTGKMERMDWESLDYYHQAVGYEDLPPEEQEAFLPLVLVVQSPRQRWISLALLLAGLGLIAAAPALVVPALRGKHQGQLVEKAQALGSPEVIFSRLEALCQTEKPVRGLRFNDTLVFWEQGFRQRLFGAGEICWAYQQTTSHKLYGLIPIGKSHALTLRTLDGQQLVIPMGKKQLEAQLQKAMETLPACVVGFSEELQQLYLTQREQFPQIAQAQRRGSQE